MKRTIKERLFNLIHGIKSVEQEPTGKTMLENLMNPQMAQVSFTAKEMSQIFPKYVESFNFILILSSSSSVALW